MRTSAVARMERSARVRNLAGHHAEAHAGLAGAGGLDGGVEGQHVGLVGQVLHRGGDVADALRGGGQAGDPLHHLPRLILHGLHAGEAGGHGRLAVAAQLLGALGDAEHVVGLAGGGAGGVAQHAGGPARLLEGAGLAGDGLAVHGGGLAQVGGRLEQPVGGAAHLDGDVAQREHQAVEGVAQLLDLPRRRPPGP
ncbi:MAG: hypothetical protein QM767_06265 [Anaeromyxobacter sp.]